MREHKNFWDRNAGLYDCFMRKDRAVYEKMYELIRPVVQDKTVLEVATGKNLITARVPSEVPVTAKESITLYADMEKAQIFDPFTEENILSRPVEKEERATA